MYVLAIDPGYRCTGWILIELDCDEGTPIDCGVIRTKRDSTEDLAKDDWRCMRLLFGGLLAVAEAGTLEAVAVETPAGSMGARPATCMHMAFAVCMGIAFKYPSELVTAGEAKLAACGDRNASKVSVEIAMATRWPGLVDLIDSLGIPVTKEEHIYDAASVAHAAWDSNVFRMARNSAKR